MPQLFDDLFYIPPDVADLQRTVTVAVALADLLNSEGNAESITFTTTFIPEFEPDNLPVPKALVFPAGIGITKTARRGHTEDHAVEIGIGRKIANEDANVRTHVKTVEEVIDTLKAQHNQVITVGGDQVSYLSIDTVLFVPERLRQRIALSVIRYTYRGFS